MATDGAGPRGAVAVRFAVRFSAGVLLATAVFVGAASGLAARTAGPRADSRAPGDLDVPNVVDRNGCRRWCDQDLAPCDPPIYKRADGRCTRDY